ncbi:hypothetical protein V6W59_05645 [Mannheimia sp. HC-2023]|uniref:hypothetical protein n=1 Tax=Mannheimia indoligenes TaxID=3103145 RepID=UPI002FE5FAC4
MSLNVTILLLLWFSVVLFGFIYILDESILQPSRNKKVSKELESILERNHLSLKKAKDIFRTRVGTIKYIDEILKNLYKSILLDDKANNSLRIRVEHLISELEVERKFQKLPPEIQKNFQALDKVIPDNVDLNVVLEKLPSFLRKKDTFFTKAFKFLTVVFSILGVISSVITINTQFSFIKIFSNL